MISVLVNTGTVILGSLIGLLLKKGIPEKVTSAVMTAIGLCTIYIGIDGALAGENVLIVIIAMVIGTIIGTLIDIDGGLNKLADWVGSKTKRNGSEASVAEGFLTASLLFCIGAMTIVGSLNAGLSGDNRMIFTKSTLDLVSSIMLSASLGIGVLLSASFVFVFQGAIVLLAQYLEPILTEATIAEITCAGSLMIIALGLNLIGVTKIKVSNFLPALVIVPIACWVAGLF